MTGFVAQAGLFLFGLAALYYGAEWLVRAASRLARALGVSALVVGLTIIAFGTSAPELIVGVLAADQGQPALALGNVIGSNVINIALILGLAAVIAPISVGSRVIRREIPVMIALTMAAGAVALDLTITAIDGMVLLVLFCGYLWLVLRSVRTTDEPEIEAEFSEGELPAGPARPWRDGALVLLGLAAMFVGARALVTSAVFFAREFGLSEVTIGLTIVALGTSLPELATVVVAAMRRTADIGVGNIVGSNIFNACAILGATALVAPIPVSQTLLWREFSLMLLVSVLLLPVARKGHVISRRDGFLLLALYVLFSGLVIASPTV